jgi:hypothetical protein
MVGDSLMGMRAEAQEKAPLVSPISKRKLRRPMGQKSSGPMDLNAQQLENGRIYSILVPAPPSDIRGQFPHPPQPDGVPPRPHPRPVATPRSDRPRRQDPALALPPARAVAGSQPSPGAAALNGVAEREAGRFTLVAARRFRCHCPLVLVRCCRRHCPSLVPFLQALAVPRSEGSPLIIDGCSVAEGEK